MAYVGDIWDDGEWGAKYKNAPRIRSPE